MLLGLAVMLAGGCAGDSGTNPSVGGNSATGQPGATPPGDGTTPPGDGTTPPVAPDPSAIVPTWYGVQANILQPFCAGCHSGANPPAGLSWEVGQYATIVSNGRMSTEISTMREVQAGNPDASYMMWKLRGQGPAGQAIVGVRMPATGVPLDPALIAVVAQWISNGALLGDPADANSGPPAPPPVTPDPPPATPDPSAIVPTWYGVQAKILQQYCTVCHSGANPPAGLSWEVGQYAAIVTNGRVSTEISTLREIQPSNPDASYLMWKLRGQGPAGQAIVGARMPATGIPLDPALIEVIAQWIGAGAPLGVPADANSGPPAPPPPPPPPPVTPNPSAIVPTWYGVQANILQRFCTVCHSGASPLAGLSWEVGQYATIVTNGRMSTEITSMREVQPGNPDASYLMWKLRGQGPAGQAIQGVRMPATGIPLDPALIEVIAQWIRDGAPLGNPADATSGGTSVPTFPVGSWMYVWTESLQVCTMCHSRTPSSPRCGRDFSCPPKGVVLTADNYNGVVDGDIVRPSRPDNSELWDRVTDNDPDKRMPFGLPPLSQRQLDIIFNWINNGAPLCPAGEVCP